MGHWDQCTVDKDNLWDALSFCLISWSEDALEFLSDFSNDKEMTLEVDTSTIKRFLVGLEESLEESVGFLQNLFEIIVILRDSSSSKEFALKALVKETKLSLE